MPYAVNPRVGTRCINGNMVAYNCANHIVSIWNASAGEVWTSIVEGLSPQAIAHKFYRGWQVAEGEALEGIMGFIEELQDGGFIEGKAPAAASDPDDDAGEATMLQIEMAAIESLTPYAVTQELTWKCNENCIHCFMEKNRAELPTEAVIGILDQLKAAGTLFISFTGGEIFVRPDALEIIDEAHKRGFVIDILSNGILIQEPIVDFLAQRRVRRVQLSIYGALAKTHDSITQVSGSHELTMHALNSLVSSGVKVEIAFPMMGPNFEERYLMKQLADGYDCVITPSPIITARNNGSNDTYDLRISDEQFRDFYQDTQLSALYNGRKPFAEHKLYFGFSDLREAPPCYSGFNTCAVTPDGRVYPCNQFLYEVGDLKRQSFEEIWHGPKLEMLREIRISDLPECRGCELLHSCSRCPGLALLEGGGILCASPENCRQARIHTAVEGG